MKSTGGRLRGLAKAKQVQGAGGNVWDRIKRQNRETHLLH